MKSPMRVTWSACALAATIVLGGCGSAQSRKAGYIQHGRQYFAAGNYDKARVEFRNAAQIDPKDPQVSFLIGQVAEKGGDIRAALGLYRAAIDENPGLSEARAAAGRLYLFGGLPDMALKMVEPGLATAPQNAQLLTVRGAARHQLGDTQAGLGDAEKAVQLAPGDDYAVALLASLYRQNANTDKAMQVVQAGLQRLPNSVDLRAILADLYVSQQQPQLAEVQLRQMVLLEPKMLANRYRLAKFYLLQKNTDAAERTLREAIAVAPDNPEPKLQLVEVLSAQHGRDRAAAEVDQLIAREPNNDTLKLTLALFLARTGLTEQAQSMLRAVITHAGKKPEGLSARNRLAELLLARNDSKSATALIDEVLTENARDNDALILRADMSLANGDPVSAVTDLRAVLRDQPNAVAVMRALARAYMQNDETELAEETLRAAVQTAPKDFDSRVELADVLISDSKLDQALPLLEQLAKDSPMSIVVQQDLYRVHSAQKHYADARESASTIQKSRPDLGLGYYLLGMVDEADNRPADAEHDYEQALKIQPGAGEPLAAVTRLDVRLKQAARSVRRLDVVIAHSPDNAVARRLKADVLSSQGQLGAAITGYEDAVKAAPAWAQAYQSLAQAQFAVKRNDDALRTLQQGVAQTQGTSALLIADLAALYERLGRTDDAIALYNSVLAKNPKSSFAANNVAMLLVTYKKDASSLARARQLADQLATVPTVDVIDTRGWVKFKSGDFHGAESLLQRAVDKSPQSPELRYHLGMAQLSSGERQTAEENLKTALSSPRPFIGMDEARAALTQLKRDASAS